MNRPWLFQTRGRIAALVVLVAVVAAFLWFRGAPKRADVPAVATTETVQRRDIEITVEATGTVEPINLVEVKSKASGLIVRMPVEIGSVVKVGDLLVQVDPRDVRNAFAQAKAALVAAEARARVAAEQKRRSDDLVAQQVITATEHEATLLDDANAQSSLIAARTNLDLAQQRLEDATVRAPIAGTVLEKPVSVGQVISSATSSVSGGTTLLKMAALSRIRMRALVVETDIGRVKEGQGVMVVVDAYPQRTFQGTVEKIEPQALVQQSVTMFPVLIAISNEEGLLLPGMNGEVTMLVDRREGVLAVPVDAVRGIREIATIAAGLGFDVDSLRSQMRSGLGGANAAGAGAGATNGAAAGAPRAAAGDSVRGRRGAAGRVGADSAGVRRGRRGGTGAGGGAAGGATGGFAAGGAMGAGNSGRSRAQVAIVKTPEGPKPRIVRIGLSDYDYAEVLGGLEEGEEVLLLSAIEIQQERDVRVSRVRERMGGGVTGTSSAPARPGATGGAGGGTGGGGGGRRGGN